MREVSSHTDEWTPVPPVIPPHWEQIDFEDAFENISLAHQKIPQKEYLSSGAIPIVDQGAKLIGGFTNDAAKSIQSRRALIVFGDHTKCFKLVRFRFAPGADGIKVLKPRIIDERFGFYACKALRLPDRGYSRHYAFLKKSKIPLAPPNEQRRIVAKIEELFSELDKGIESLKTARAQLKVYRQVVLKHAFEGKLTAQWREENKDKLETAAQLLTRIRRQRDALYEQQLKDWKVAIKNWEEKDRQGKRLPKPRKFRETENIRSDEIDGLPSIPRDWRLVRLCQIAQIGTGMSVSATRTLEDPLDVPYLRVANVQRGYLDLSAVKTMTIEKSQLDRLQLKKWDVLFNEGGDRDKLGRGWIWQSQIAPCITQNHVFRASSFMASKFNSKIISYWANAFGQQYFEKKGKQTTNLASINKTVLSHFPIPLIPREEQEELCKQIEKFMTILDTQEQEITSAFRLAGLLRQSILKEAFSGQLVEQDPNEEPATVLLERIKAERASQKPRANTRQRKVANA